MNVLGLKPAHVYKHLIILMSSGPFFKNALIGVGEMAQWLKAFLALVEDLVSISSNHMVADNHL